MNLINLPNVGEAILGSDYSALIPFFAGMIIFAIIVLFVLYIYTSLAMMAIAKKVNHPHPGLVWIPFVGQYLVASQIAKMPWWPILFLIGTVIPFVGNGFGLALLVFDIIWMWKTYEAVQKPGWWAIFMLFPPVGLILLGIAAWSKK
ncbi:Uncharacterised protein [uncultured archaeon]|nr:Uncharacterised protein [uncultured archaeon]